MTRHYISQHIAQQTGLAVRQSFVFTERLTETVARSLATAAVEHKAALRPLVADLEPVKPMRKGATRRTLMTA